MRKFSWLFVTTICFLAFVAQAQTPEQVEAWKAQAHCIWKDADGVKRPHPVIAFADESGIAMVPASNGELFPLQTKAPYMAVCSVHLLPKGEKMCPKGGCFREAKRKPKDCKNEVPVVDTAAGIPYSSTCWHIAKKRERR